MLRNATPSRPGLVPPDAAASGGQKVVTLDKPLARRVWTLRDKHDLLYKYAGLTAGLALGARPAPPATTHALNGSASAWRRSGPQLPAPSLETRFDLWRVGEDLDLVVRSRIHARQAASPGAPLQPAGGTGRRGAGRTRGQAGRADKEAASGEGVDRRIPILIRGKAEYLGEAGVDLAEDATLLEHARRWAAKTFHVGARLLVRPQEYPSSASPVSYGEMVPRRCSLVQPFLTGRPLYSVSFQLGTPF